MCQPCSTHLWLPWWGNRHFRLVSNALIDKTRLSFPPREQNQLCCLGLLTPNLPTTGWKLRQFFLSGISDRTTKRGRMQPKHTAGPSISGSVVVYNHWATTHKQVWCVCVCGGEDLLTRPRLCQRKWTVRGTESLIAIWLNQCRGKWRTTLFK